MSGSKFIAGASALLALSGVASAFSAPRGPYMYARAVNGSEPTTPVVSVPTTTPNGTAPVTTPTNGASDAGYCPNFDLQVIVTPSSVDFLLECNTDHFGLKIEIDIPVKRAVYTSIGDCLDVCATSDLCIATSFNTDTAVCTYFETVGAAFTSPNTDFAMKVDAADTASTAVPTLAPTVTGTITETAIGTIYSCAATVTDCPYADRGAAVVTETISLFTTYCPGNAVTTVNAAALSGCGCSASGVTATVYSPTVATFTALSTTSTIFVPVATHVVNYPVGAGSAASTVATVTASGVAGATGTSTGATEAFTGAAGHIEAGMGLAGAAAIVAFML